MQQSRVQDSVVNQAGGQQTREQWLSGVAEDPQVAGASFSDSSSGGSSTYATMSLLHASFKGDAVLVEKILSDNKTIDVNAVDEKGRTALALAVASGHVDVATLLLEKGNADVNEKNKYGWTPLMVCFFEQI